jgi:predicted dehydrogenase
VCDLDPALQRRAQERFPGVRVTAALDDVLADPDVQALAVAVDAPNHHGVAKRALLAGRHVLVEKPLTLAAADGEELCGLAEQGRLVLMVGHLLLYHPAVAVAKAALDAGELGEPRYLRAERVSLGVVRETESAWWSLAPHDIAVAIHLFGELPVSVSATGAAYLRPGREDVAFASLAFPGGRLAHVHVSWIDPDKRRALTVVGSKRTLTFAGAPGGEAVTIAGPGGEVVAPRFGAAEPLLAECEHFVACASSGARPRSDGRQGLAVVKVLAAGERSMRRGGAPEPVA